MLLARSPDLLSLDLRIHNAQNLDDIVAAIAEHNPMLQSLNLTNVVSPLYLDIEEPNETEFRYNTFSNHQNVRPLKPELSRQPKPPTSSPTQH